MSRLLLLVEVLFLFWTRLGWCQSPARQAGYLYLSPVPQASYVSDQTSFVLVRFVNAAPGDVTNLTTDFLTVTGAASGEHPGTIGIATDGKTVIFTNSTAFTPNEMVTVVLNPLRPPGAPGNVAPFSYQFRVTAPMPGSVPYPSAAPGPTAGTPQPVAKNVTLRPRVSASPTPGGLRRKAKVLSNGVSVPGDFPVSVITASTNPSPGDLFLENALDGISPYSMILDNSGMPVWYNQGRMFDFKVQKNGSVTWCTYDDAGLATFTVMDQNLNVVRTLLTTNGYLTDGHDLKILPDGRYFMIGSRDNSVNLGQYIYGDGVVNVTETVVQGFTAAGELIFQWRCWDNYDIRDLQPSGNTDFAHMNGIDIDQDGNLLVSCRHLSEVTKVDINSGDILWRLSGAHSSFSFRNDPLGGTSYQHNISALGNGHYMVFDNGDYHSTVVSRAVEYQLDLTNMIANLVWQFRDKPDKYAYWMGSAQRLPSGNTLIDFVLAQYPKAIEVDTNGIKRFELSLAPSSDSYRAFRFPWHGVVAAPYLVAEPQADNITLLFNKFGDTNVAFYRIYGGTSPHPTTLLDESQTTLRQLTDLQNGTNYFRVTAVGTDGVESPFSNEASVDVNITPAGQNLVQNGDFAEGASSWISTIGGNAEAVWTAEGGTAHFYITAGGTSLSDIQLAQGGMGLILGNEYVLEFDAWSDQSGYIQPEVAQSVSPFVDYSGVAPAFLTPVPTHFRDTFTMENPSDFSAKLLFKLGGSLGDVYLANISLFSPVPADLNQDGHVDELDLSILCGQWLKQQNGLSSDLDANGRIDFNDFNLLGRSWGLGTR